MWFSKVISRLFGSILGQEMLLENLKKLDRDEATKSCEHLDDVMRQMRAYLNEPNYEIYTIISELKRRVDLGREELKASVDDEAMTLLDELDAFETACRQRTDAVLDARYRGHIEDMLDKCESSLTSWMSELNSSTTAKFLHVRNESSSLAKMLQGELNKHSNELFSQRLNEYELKQKSFCNRTSNERKLDVRIENVSQLQRDQIKYFSSEDRHGLGFLWNVNVEIDENQFIVVYLAVKGDTNNSVLSINYDLAILNRTNPVMSYIKECDYSFVMNTSDYGNKLLNLSEVLTNANFYDVVEDRITIQAKLTKIEWLN